MLQQNEVRSVFLILMILYFIGHRHALYVDSSITSHVILQINVFLNPSEMSVWQYRILITFYMMVLQCSQWLRRQNILIYAMLAIIMNLGFMMSYIP